MTHQLDLEAIKQRHKEAATGRITSEWINSAYEDIPKLVEEVQRLRKENEKLNETADIQGDTQSMLTELSHQSRVLKRLARLKKKREEKEMSDKHWKPYSVWEAEQRVLRHNQTMLNKQKEIPEYAKQSESLARDWAILAREYMRIAPYYDKLIKQNQEMLNLLKEIKQKCCLETEPYPTQEPNPEDPWIPVGMQIKLDEILDKMKYDGDITIEGR